MLFLSRKFLKIFLKNIGVNNSILDESGDFPPTFMIKGSFNIDKYAAISGGDCPDEFTKSGTMIRVHLQTIKNLLPENLAFY